MNKKKITMMMGSLVLVGMIGIGATLAYFTDQSNAENIITMGHVDIDLEEPNFDTITSNKTIENVKPGQEITKDPTITVKKGSADSYIRVSLQIEGLSEKQEKELLTMENGVYRYLDIDLTKWQLSKDGYFYYIGQYPGNDTAGVLKAEQSVKLFTNVTIPATWGNEVADTSFKMNIKAEAIQAEHFQPSTINGVYGWYQGSEAITPETYQQSKN